jgi:hypothetical protein
MKMVITFKQLGNYGKLGNALFEAAATIAVAKRHNDTYLFPSWSYSAHFSIPQDKFRAQLPQLHFQYEEPQYAYTEIPYRGNMNIHGYFQSERYFQDAKINIMNLLTPKPYVEVKSGVASVHVRRGDYLKFKDCYEILNMDYYEPAMEATGAKKFLVFSDDMRWCKQHFKGNQFEFAEGNSAVADLSSMAACSHNIIANSSFSWWGAWLNRNPVKKVIAPKNWFGPKLAPTHPTTDLIPKNWIQI